MFANRTLIFAEGSVYVDPRKRSTAIPNAEQKSYQNKIAKVLFVAQPTNCPLPTDDCLGCATNSNPRIFLKDFLNLVLFLPVLISVLALL